MPYDLKKARGKDLYWVITKGTGVKHSKEPLPLQTAIAQMRALYRNVPDARGGMLPIPPPVKVVNNPMRLIQPSHHALMNYATGDETTKGKTLRAFMKWIYPDMEKQGATEERIKDKFHEMGFVKYVPKGGAIDNAEAIRISKGSYGTAEAKVGEAELIKQTPTLAFYKKGNEILIGVRGTKGLEDWISNLTLASSNKFLFQHTPRVARDVKEIKEFQKQYPPSQYHYKAVGHSLGGAIIDEMIKQGLIKEGVSYNPAVHRNDLANPESQNKRIYDEKDPLRVLGLLAGQSQKDADIRKSKIDGNLLEHHTIHNPTFEGGGNKPSKPPLSSTPPPETSRKHLNHSTFFEKKGDPFLLITHITPTGEKSFVQFFTPEDFFKSPRWETIKLTNQYAQHRDIIHLAKEWRKLNDKPEDDEEEGSGYGGMMPYAEHKKKMKELREENLAKQRAKSNFSPIQVPPPPPPPPPLKSNRKIAFPFYRTAPPVFKGEGIHGKFHQQIVKAGMTPEAYMRAVLKNAKANGYGEYTADIEFSDDDVHKLMIKTEHNGHHRTERFGRVGYGDFVLWSHSNPEVAKSKKDTFHRSHEAIKGKWKDDPLSPNNLSLHILW